MHRGRRSSKNPALTVARNDGVQILDIGVERVPERLIVAERRRLSRCLCGTLAECIRCIQGRSIIIPSQHHDLFTIQTRIKSIIQVLPNLLDSMAATGVCELQHIQRRIGETYGGMWTNATAARLSPGGPHTESISFVSCSIHDATESSTQSGTAVEFCPAVLPAG